MYEEIIQQTRELCEKFIKKVETGQARSVETYADCKALLERLNEIECEHFWDIDFRTSSVKCVKCGERQ